MGKGLNDSELILRDGKLAFYGKTTATSYDRMEGFTQLSTSLSPQEYTRKYIDERSERTDTTGMTRAKAFAFDRYKGNPIHDDIAKIADDEIIGSDALRTIIVADMCTLDEAGTTADAFKRDYTVVPDTYGDGTDALTYSGNFKANGEKENIKVTSSDNWQTITIVTENN